MLAKVGFGCELDLADGHKPQSDLTVTLPTPTPPVAYLCLQSQVMLPLGDENGCIENCKHRSQLKLMTMTKLSAKMLIFHIILPSLPNISTGICKMLLHGQRQNRRWRAFIPNTQKKSS